MADETNAILGNVQGIRYVLKPEELAGKTWWRVFVGGHPKVLVRHREYALAAAEALAADEAMFRREATRTTV